MPPTIADLIRADLDGAGLPHAKPGRDGRALPVSFYSLRHSAGVLFESVGSACRPVMVATDTRRLAWAGENHRSPDSLSYSATKRHFEELSERHGYGGELADEFMDRCARGDFRLVDSLIDLVDWMRDRTGPADGTRHLLESAFETLKANGYELSTTGPICWRRIPTAADPAPQAGPMTVAKMRAILSALPADAEIYSETEGDYPAWMVVSHAGIPFRLVRFRAGESIGEMLEREQGER